MKYLMLLLLLVVTCTACETTRKRDADRRSGLDTYTYTYEMAPNAIGVRVMTPGDRRHMRTLEDEGWRPTHEDRTVRDGVEVVTVHFER